ncbi:SDR family NAD(P)-dependent oxidoreductase [Actinoplanes sp. L3-i22]|uniref:SDR family NAD(P)-dependent oxidoreductase n=1 Tax=Actinoplanes sp. L3-i22 TaxID=2836373 RepID=UPI001C769882|nr:SDR family NAD(P)-dependent oxidoreductase [Actinoplanes sp. L3-i22]BCY10574.1 3-oxoacyl-ACP reductase [Actinoplanes sp. L3-i22]
MTDLLDLSGRVALVTGSTRGIGWRTAQLLAAHRATVIVNGHTDAAAVTARAGELETTYGRPASGVVCDVTDPAGIRRAYQLIFKEHGRLDVLVNNAGILDDALLGMVSDEMIERSFQVNTFGAIHHLQAAARLMQRKNEGSIVNLSSIVGVVGNEGQTVYSATKSALIGLTKSAAKELAPRQIRVNAVAPGFIDTDMTRALPPERFAERAAGIKMGRTGTPDDIARSVLFFASDMSRYVTGQVLGVDGGMLV